LITPLRNLEVYNDFKEQGSPSSMQQWKKLACWGEFPHLCRIADVSPGKNTTSRSYGVGYTGSTVSLQGRWV
jgi:hypothetical protein